MNPRRSALMWTILLGIMLTLAWTAPGLMAHGDPDHTTSNSIEGESGLSATPAARAGTSALARPDGTAASRESEHGHEEPPEPGWIEWFLPGFTGAPNLHPLFVPFPIVFLIAATPAAWGAWIVGSDRLLAFTEWLFWAGAATLLIAAISGFVAVGGWGGGHVTTHRNLMLAVAVGCYLLLGVSLVVRGRSPAFYRGLLAIGLLGVSLGLMIGADRGAWLAFVEGVGVRSSEHQHDHSVRPGTTRPQGQTGLESRRSVLRGYTRRGAAPGASSMRGNGERLIFYRSEREM